jgi:hypothetical protein
MLDRNFMPCSHNAVFNRESAQLILERGAECDENRSSISEVPRMSAPGEHFLKLAVPLN